MNDLKKDLSRELEEHLVLSAVRKKQILQAVKSSGQQKTAQRNWQYPFVLTTFAMLSTFFIFVLVLGGSGDTINFLNNQKVNNTEGLIENGVILFQTDIQINWFTILFVVAALILCMFYMKLRSMRNIYSKITLIGIVLSFIAVISLGHNYLESFELQDGIGVSNPIAKLLIGTDAWSREGFAGIFSISVSILIIFVFLYPLVLILESGHKWRFIIVSSIVGVTILCFGAMLIVDSPLKLTDITIEENDSLYVDVMNKGYFPIKIKEIQKYGTVQEVKLLVSQEKSSRNMLELGLKDLAIQPSFVKGTIQHYSLLINNVHAGELIEVSYTYLGIPLKKLYVVNQ